MDTTYYVVFIVGAIALICLLYFFSWRKKPAAIEAKREEKAEETKSTTPSFEVRTYDVSTRRAYNETISGDTVDETRKTHGNLGRKWLYEGRWLYALKKDAEGDYSPVIIPVSMDNPPSRLHRALTHPQVNIVYNVEPAKNIFQKYGHIFLFAGVCVFLMFMLVA